VSNPKILVVEDEAVVAEDVRIKLKGLQYDVAAVTGSGEEAVKLAETERPDLVLMDIRLEGPIDGPEAAQRIRDRLGIPVVYVTAYADDRTLARAKITEPYGYILKPFRTKDLHSTIETALYKHRMERELEATRQRLAATLDSMADALIAADADGRVMLINPVAEHLTGWSREEALGRDVEDVFKIINAETRASGKSMVANALRSGVAVDMGDHDFLLISKDGKEIAIDDSAAPIRDHKGGVTGAVLVFRDVTDRRRSEDALRESEKRFRETLDSMLEGCQIIDSDWRYVYVNNAAARQGRHSEEELLGHTMMEMYPGIESTEMFAALRRCMDARISHRMENEFTFPDGSKGRFDLSIHPVPEGVFMLSVDITERKRAEEEIARLAKFPEEDPSPVLRVSGKGVLLYANAPSSPLLSAWHCAVGEPLPDPWRGRVADALSSGQARQIEAECGARIFTLTLAPVPDADYVNIYGRDVTERRLAVEALRESEEWFRSVFEGSRDAILITDGDARFVDANEAASALTGYSREELTHMSIPDLADPEDPDALKTCFARIMAGEAVERELLIRRKDGATIQAEFSFRKVLIRDVPCVQAVVRDITERKRAEQALRSSREELRALAGVLQSIREEERTLLARKIHDDMGHALAAVKMDLYVRTRAELQERVKAVSGQLDSVIQAARRIAGELRPALLDDFGLLAALEWEAEQLQNRTQIKCAFESSLAEVSLERERSISLFRACEELLTNVALHSNASAAKLAVRQDAGDLVLEISDNGRGIAREEVYSSKSFGLVGVRERLHLLGGRLTVSGRPGKGTTATMRVPYGAQKDTPDE